MYLFFEEGHLHPTCMSNKSPGMRLQAGLEAAPDLNKGLNEFLEFLSKSRATHTNVSFFFLFGNLHYQLS